MAASSASFFLQPISARTSAKDRRDRSNMGELQSRRGRDKVVESRVAPRGTTTLPPKTLSMHCRFAKRLAEIEWTCTFWAYQNPVFGDVVRCGCGVREDLVAQPRDGFCDVIDHKTREFLFLGLARAHEFLGALRQRLNGVFFLLQNLSCGIEFFDGHGHERALCIEQSVEQEGGKEGTETHHFERGTVELFVIEHAHERISVKAEPCKEEKLCESDLTEALGHVLNVAYVAETTLCRGGQEGSWLVEAQGRRGVGVFE